VNEKPDIPSPNADLDVAIKKLVKKASEKDIPPDTAVKILAMAINWEKVKHGIVTRESEFNPDDL
jgi:uncharacterized membrane protein